jgi:hypothetical protein
MLLARLARVAFTFVLRASVAETETEQAQQETALVSISADFTGLVSANALSGMINKPRIRTQDARAGMVFMVLSSKDPKARHATYEKRAGFKTYDKNGQTCEKHRRLRIRSWAKQARNPNSRSS